MKTFTHNTLEVLFKSGFFSPLDFHFAQFIERLSGGTNPEVALAAALVSYYRSKGHICFHLGAFFESELPLEILEARVVFPPLSAWVKKLRKSSVVGKPGEFRPLILDEVGRLYLHRYWQYEKSLADQILSRLQAVSVEESILAAGLERLFPATTNKVNWQKVAAFTAVTKKFCVITGGPGTGKTSTVLKILALLLEQGIPANGRIVLAAPTGKAAARLAESIHRAQTEINCSEELRCHLPTEASTIHRLLGSRPGSTNFRYNAQNLLSVSAVIVDEASMVDLALMSKLFAAIPQDARIILLGDKDQLSSVEAGAALADICGGQKTNEYSAAFCQSFERVTGQKLPESSLTASNAIQDCIVELQENHRFGNESGIHLLSQAARESNVVEARKIVDAGHPDISWNAPPAVSKLTETLTPMVMTGFKNYLAAKTPEEVLQRFGSFRILSALRNGPFGVVRLNEIVETILSNAGLIDTGEEWYHGRPIMIGRNDYNLGLFNGDIGLILKDESGELRAFFPGDDGALRKFPPARLPSHETVFAMTIHKSQGSEFGNVLLVLPDRENPVLTRELIYTGLTRARHHVALFGVRDIFEKAILRSVERDSGLRDQLQKCG